MEYLNILVKLRKIMRSVNLESKKVEKQFGISLPQLLVLKYLSEQKDYTTSASKIKDFINLNASTVSGIIQRLEGKGMIARLPKREDKRSNQLTLTAKGAELIKDTPSSLQNKLANRIANLSKSEIESLLQNIDLLDQIMDTQAE